MRREVMEEVGVTVGELHYFQSQPWPFPHSLMVGFVARWAGGRELLDARHLSERRLLNIVDEMAISSGMKRPTQQPRRWVCPGGRSTS